jgi:uncharacterized membrane protein YczE
MAEKRDGAGIETGTRFLLLRIVLMLLGITFSYTGSALCAFAAIGQGPVGAFQYSVSVLSGMKMGTVALLFQGTFVFLQFLLERSSFKPRQLLQLLITFYGGVVLNLVLYGLLGLIREPLPYVVRLAVLVFGFALNAFGVSLSLESDTIRVPMEGFLLLLSQRLPVTLGRLKQISDWLLLALSLVICLAGHVPLTVREGTVLNALLFGLFLDVFHSRMGAFFNKLKGVVEDGFQQSEPDKSNK